MSTFFAVKYMDTPNCIFKFRQDLCKSLESHLEEVPQLVGDFFNDGYEMEGCTLLNWLELPKDRELYLAALSLIDDEDTNFLLAMNGEAPFVIPDESVLPGEQYERTNLAVLKAFVSK